MVMREAARHQRAVPMLMGQSLLRLSGSLCKARMYWEVKKDGLVLDCCC